MNKAFLTVARRSYVQTHWQYMTMNRKRNPYERANMNNCPNIHAHRIPLRFSLERTSQRSRRWIFISEKIQWQVPLRNFVALAQHLSDRKSKKNNSMSNEAPNRNSSGHARRRSILHIRIWNISILYPPSIHEVMSVHSCRGCHRVFVW